MNVGHHLELISFLPPNVIPLFFRCKGRVIFGGVCHWQADPRLAVGGLRSSAASHIQARDVILGRFGGFLSAGKASFFHGMFIWMFDM